MHEQRRAEQPEGKGDERAEGAMEAEVRASTFAFFASRTWTMPSQASGRSYVGRRTNSEISMATTSTAARASLSAGRSVTQSERLGCGSTSTS